MHSYHVANSVVAVRIVMTCSPACTNGGSCDTGSGRCMCPPGIVGEDCSGKLKHFKR